MTVTNAETKPATSGSQGGPALPSAACSSEKCHYTKVETPNSLSSGSEACKVTTGTTSSNLGACMPSNNVSSGSRGDSKSLVSSSIMSGV